MIQDVKNRPISEVLSIDKELMYIIPKYQRAYTWGQSHWDLLFEDILDNNKGYFLGSMICVRSKEQKGSLDTTLLELIDGQQRITSVSLLLLSIYKKLEPYKESGDLDEDANLEFNKIRKELVQKNSETQVLEPRLKLQIQDNNKYDYDALLAEQGLITGCKKRANAGNRRIYKAYSHFCHLIDNYLTDADNAQDPLTALLDLYSKINNASIVMIEVSNYSDAFMLFESLNFRGAKLNVIDLIKNSLMAKADRDNVTDEEDGMSNADKCYEKWQEIQMRLGDEFSLQERFFRQYYNAFSGELQASYGVDSLPSRATRSTLMRIYEKLIERDYKKLIRDINVASEKYEVITNKNIDDVSVEYSNELLNLERIQGAPSYTLLLFLELNKEKMGLTEEHLAKITHILTLFFVRRNITDFPGTRKLDKLFMDLIELVKDKTGDEAVRTLFEEIVKQSSTDKTFKEKLCGPIYDENSSATRFILCYMESMHQTKEVHTDLWSRDEKDRYIWTIEHIFPEGENLPDTWVRMINGLDENALITKVEIDQAGILREKYTHTIGNLTMTGYNSNLGNKSFEYKKERKDSKGNYIGYRNGLELNKDVVSEDTWTVDKIQARTDKLVAEALELFKFSY